jgi:hypothetical protein
MTDSKDKRSKSSSSNEDVAIEFPKDIKGYISNSPFWLRLSALAGIAFVGGLLGRFGAGWAILSVLLGLALVIWAAIGAAKNNTATLRGGKPASKLMRIASLAIGVVAFVPLSASIGSAIALTISPYSQQELAQQDAERLARESQSNSGQEESAPEDSSNNEESSQQSTEETDSTQDTQGVFTGDYKIGDVIDLWGWGYTWQVEFKDEYQHEQFGRLQRYMVKSCVPSNGQAVNFSTNEWVAVDANYGRYYASTYWTPRPEWISPGYADQPGVEVGPGDCIRGYLVFEATEDITELRLAFPAYSTEPQMDVRITP